MNNISIFFLISLIFLIGLIDESFADEIEYGENYNRTIQLSNGTHTTFVWDSLSYDRINDNGIYKDFIFTDNPNNLSVETEGASVTLDKNSCTFNFYNKGLIENKSPLLTDSITALNSINGTGIFNEVTQISNASCNVSWNGSELTATKFVFGIGLLEYKYILNNGIWKTQLEVTNLTTLTNRLFGFDQSFNLNSDIINYGGSQKNLDNFDGVTFDRSWLINNKAKVIELLNGYNFDFDIAFDNLDSISVFDTGVNKSQLVFHYRYTDILLPNVKLIEDPTYEEVADDRGRVYSNTGTIDCDLRSGVTEDSLETITKRSTPTSCQIQWMEWDDLSVIPTDGVVDSAYFEWDQTTTALMIENCTFYAYTNQPSTLTGQQRWDQGWAGVQVNSTGTALCFNDGTNKQLSFDSTGIANLQANIVGAEGWYGGMFQMITPTVDGSGRTFEMTTGESRLSITYTTILAPDSITDLTSTSIGTTSINLDWTEPNLNGESLIGYQINFTTPQSSTVKTIGTIFKNDTGVIDDIITGLTSGTDYSSTVSAWTIGGNNVTFANVYNFTTLSGPSIPTGLIATSSSVSIIGLDWDDAPAVDNITGYRIFQESPTGNGFILLENDTASSTSSYSDTLLTTKTQYNYLVAGINATGVGGNSTASADYTWGIPDGVTGFTIINPTVDTLNGTYTASIPFGFSVTGYEVLQDNVFLSYPGNVTTFLASLLDPVTSYEFSVRALTSFGNSTWVNATGTTVTSPPTSLVVTDCYHTCTTQLDLNFLAPDPSTGVNGYKIERETPVGNGWNVLVANTSSTDLFYNNTSLNAGQFYNYRIYALTPDGESEVSNTYAASPHKLPDSIDDLVVTSNELLQFLLAWSTPDLYGFLSGYMINYTTPVGDPLIIHTADTGSSSVSAVLSGFDPTLETSFRISAVTGHGTNATLGNIVNATLTNEIQVGDLDFSVQINPNVIPISYVLYSVDSNTDDVQVQFDSSLTVDCNVSYRLAGTNVTYSGLSETTSGSFVYHNFTVTNAGNDILDWDCFDQTDGTINGQYSLTQSLASSGVGGIANVPLFAQINNFSGGLYGTSGDFGGIDLITMFIVIVSMLGFNRTNPALGVGVMATMLGAAYYFELIPWTSGVLGGIAVVVILAIGMGLKKRD